MTAYYFAWVDETDTIFGHEHYVVDETILTFKLEHDEGQIPTLNLTIKNPRVGLLSPHRKQWAWFSYEDATGHVQPLFFGVLVAIPSDLFKETIVIKLIARSPNYIQNKQAVAETMKIRPYYDPVFIDLGHRDEPDTVLEGWSALWHVDRLTLAITASDILTGEDGTIVFTGNGDALYESIFEEIGEAPLTNIQVQATVNWTQRTTGFISGPTVSVASYTGDTFLSEWPKPGAGLGGGWTVESSFVFDVYKVNLTPMASASATWENKKTDLNDCETNSTASSATYPALLSPNPISFLLTVQTVSGDCEPDANPPINKPSSGNYTGEIVPAWYLNCDWNLRYDAKREFSERIIFDITANVQSIVTSPTVTQHTELITVSGANVGEQLIEVEAWSDFAGQPVEQGTIIFPNNPTTPGGLSYQICFAAGTAGEIEPTFSDIPGTITIDNTAQWASMGSNPLVTQPAWSNSTYVGLGEIIYYVPKTFNTASGDWEDNLTGVYLLCVQSGETNSTYIDFTYIPDLTDSDEATPAPVQVSVIQGPNVPGFHWSWPNWVAPEPGPGIPGFFDNVEVTIVNGIQDGNAGWAVLGGNPSMLGIPIGGTPISVTANAYFPTDRGLWSVEYLICKGRARLRLRSRAVKIGWDCPIENVMGLSCRMNATLYDPRLQGGAATGKIIKYSMSGDSNGKFRGHVDIGVAVGVGGSIVAIEGEPCWINDYFIAGQYQQYIGSVSTITGDDIGYTAPAYQPYDDGLVFPLTKIPGIDSAQINGSLSAQIAAIMSAIPSTQYLAAIQEQAGLTVTVDAGDQVSTSSGVSAAGAWWIEELQLHQVATSIPYMMEATPVSYEVFIKPVTNGPFSGSYSLDVTPLEIPMGIDLMAISEV